MAYNINITSGQNLVTVSDGTVNSSSTSLVLIGKNYAGYGEFINENFVKLLENFSNSAPPPAPLTGQLYWDTTDQILKVFSGSVWKTVSSSTTANVAPTGPVIGDTWWDTVNSQYKVWTGSTWSVIGPAYTSNQGQTGSVADVVIDNTGSQSSHVVVKFFVNNTLVAVLSKDAEFTTTNLPGFTVIKPGFTFSTLAGYQYYGDADNALNLGGIPAAEYLRGSASIDTTEPVTITNNLGLTVGVNDDFNIGVTSTDVDLTGTVSGKNLGLRVKVGGITTRLLTLDGATGSIRVAANPVEPLGIATKQYVDNRTNVAGPTLLRDGTNTITGSIVPNGNNTIDFGSATTKFATIYATTFNGTATNAASLGGVPAANFVTTGAPSSSTSLFRDGSNTVTGSILPDVNGLRNLGSSAVKFGTIYATTFNGNATSADYADLAERFESDSEYLPGTVVQIGGDKEITAVKQAFSDDVFGVISSDPAYLMNAASGSNATHPPVALSGRVAVRVVGVVSKGDRLVSAGAGLSRAASIDDVTPHNVIGRALENKTTTGEGTVLAIVRINL